MRLASALRRQSHPLIWLLAGTMLSTTPALAQTAPEAEASADEGVIVVTARKREESIEDVPFAIQALGAATLEQNQVGAFDDYAKLLPSVSFQSFGPGQSQIYFRGVASGANANGSHSGPQPTSALYVDEVPLTTIGGAPDLHIYDMERVEALSGPQGTLYGASSLSGTLRLITKKPDTSKTEYGYDVTGTTFGKGANSSGGTLEGFFNVPLSATVAFRASAFYERDGGFISNVPGSRTYQIEEDDGEDGTTLVNFGPVTNSRFVKKNFNDVETWGGRAALGIDLDSNWTATPAIIYQSQRSHGTYLYDQKVGDLQVQDFTPDYSSDEWTQAMLTIHGKLGSWDVTYAGGYFGRDTDLFQDYSSYTLAYDQFAPYYVSFFNEDGSILDPTQSYRGRDHYTKHSEELRFSSPSGGRWHLTAGLFFERQSDRIWADYFVPGLAATGMGITVPKCATDDIFCTRVNRIDRDYAGFVDGSYDLMPNLTVNAGIRYFVTRNSLSGFSGFASTTGDPTSCAPSADPNMPCLLFDKTIQQDGETHKLNLTWKFEPTAMVYATYSTGFRPGGINRRVGVNPYKADTLDNFEVGLKTQMFNRMLTLNVAAFYEDWKNLQYGLTSAGAVGVISTYNAGTAHIKGIEGDFTLRAGPVTFSGSGTYVDAKLVTAFCPIAPSGNPDCSDPDTVAAGIGTPLPIQPKFKGNVSARYSFPLGKADGYAQVSVGHQSGTRSYLTDVEADLLGSTSGFTTVDFSIGGKFGNYSVEAFLQNAFDERGILSLNTACVPTICGAYARAYPIKPQQFGLKLSARY